MRTLSVAQQQVVEVVKARSLDARIVVMDEPTAALAGDEAEALLALVRRLPRAGDRASSTSRTGCARSSPSPTASPSSRTAAASTRCPPPTRRPGGWCTMMVGRELDAYFPDRGQPRATSATSGSRSGAAPTPCWRGIDLEVRAGEIVGVGGLQGAGRTELVRAVFGADPFTAGAVERRRAAAPPALAAGRRSAPGSGFLTEDRKAEGLVLGQSVRDNALLARRARVAARGRRVRAGRRRRARWPPSTELRAASLEQEVRFLLGRQPAEGRAGQVAGARARRAAVRRADPGHRRRAPRRPSTS